MLPLLGELPLRPIFTPEKRLKIGLRSSPPRRARPSGRPLSQLKLARSGPDCLRLRHFQVTLALHLKRLPWLLLHSASDSRRCGVTLGLSSLRDQSPHYRRRQSASDDADGLRPNIFPPPHLLGR